MSYSRAQKRLVIALLTAAYLRKASCLHQQPADHITHHLEGDQPLRPSITGALVGPLDGFVQQNFMHASLCWADSGSWCSPLQITWQGSPSASAPPRYSRPHKMKYSWRGGRSSMQEGKPAPTQEACMPRMSSSTKNPGHRQRPLARSSRMQY